MVIYFTIPTLNKNHLQYSPLYLIYSNKSIESGKSTTRTRKLANSHPTTLIDSSRHKSRSLEIILAITRTRKCQKRSTGSEGFASPCGHLTRALASIIAPQESTSGTEMASTTKNPNSRVSQNPNSTATETTRERSVGKGPRFRERRKEGFSGGAAGQ